MKITVKVIPNAKENAVVGEEAGLLKIRIKGTPKEGKANEELIGFLSEVYHISKSKIKIVSGHASRIKRVELDV